MASGVSRGILVWQLASSFSHLRGGSLVCLCPSVGHSEDIHHFPQMTPMFLQVKQTTLVSRVMRKVGGWIFCNQSPSVQSFEYRIHKQHKRQKAGLRP